LAMNNQTVHHGDSYDEEYDEEYDQEVPNNRRMKNDENMLMGMGLLGVVATQHIREEYDDEDDEDEEEYGAEQAPPVNEGGGPSSSNENNYDQIVYHTNEPQKTAPSMSHQRLAASKTTQKFKPQEPTEDDESNINSDEQNEYLDS
jgi:hypothetical protein